jgi:hypothetical protein
VPGTCAMLCVAGRVGSGKLAKAAAMRVVLCESSGLVRLGSTPSPTSLVDFPWIAAIMTEL